VITRGTWDESLKVTHCSETKRHVLLAKGKESSSATGVRVLENRMVKNSASLLSKEREGTQWGVVGGVYPKGHKEGNVIINRLRKSRKEHRGRESLSNSTIPGATGINAGSA